MRVSDQIDYVGFCSDDDVGELGEDISVNESTFLTTNTIRKKLRLRYYRRISVEWFRSKYD